MVLAAILLKLGGYGIIRISQTLPTLKTDITIVVAGIFLLTRLNPILQDSKTITTACLLLGATTTLFAAASATTHIDIKKIIALSTTSQLGLIITIIGLNQPSLAFLHIITHSFFKALIFLCSGSFIHNLNNEQDVRAIGALTITLIATILSASYSTRIITLSLTGYPRLKHNHHTETKNTINPLIRLTIISILAGTLTKLTTLQNTALTTIPIIIKLSALIATLIGISISNDLLLLTHHSTPKKQKTLSTFFNQLAFFSIPHRTVSINTLKISQQTSIELLDL
ncbi:NADH-ubiquinone oxidoreductase chain 5, partial [Ophiophagus hannah]